MAEARAAFGLPPMSPGLRGSLGFTESQTHFAHRVLARFTGYVHVRVSGSSMVCSGAKTLALVVKVLHGAQVSMFALRDRADPACCHSRCDKRLCKLGASHTFCKSLMALDSLVQPFEAGLGFGGYSSRECDIFL